MILHRVEYLAAASSFGLYKELQDAQRWLDAEQYLVISNIQVFQVATIDPLPWKAFVSISFSSTEAQQSFLNFSRT